MTVWTLGSINLDHVYQLARLPRPGETIAARSLAIGLGGKGANQSIAAARAGAAVRHIGRVGADGATALAALAAAGVDCRHVVRAETATGHAIILVAADGENAIVVHPGANRGQDPAAIAAALDGAAPGDTLLIQNETDGQAAAARAARARGVRVVYSAAPFDAAAARAMLPLIDALALNTVEAAQLSATLGVAPGDLPVPELLVTRGAGGALWRGPGGTIAVPGVPVTPVDTTGAGDTFLGWFAGRRDAGDGIEPALCAAAAAAALQVTRPGAAAAIPGRDEVGEFLRRQSG
jgi:ribokinase